MNTYTISEEKKENELFRLIKKLWESGSIPKSMVNPRDGSQKNVPEYDLCRVYENELRNYLAVTHFDLRHDPNRDIFYITSEDMKGPALSKDMTYILFLLNLIYDEKMNENSLKGIYTTPLEIRQKGSDTGLLSEKVKKSREIFKILRQRNILSFNGSANDIRDDTKMYINDVIAIVTNPARYAELSRMLDQKEREDREKDSGMTGGEEDAGNETDIKAE